jgi:hypothetical protein
MRSSTPPWPGLPIRRLRLQPRPVARAFALASVPAAAGLARRLHRMNVRAIDAHPIQAPQVPGDRRQLHASWGSITYRWVPGDPSRPALVLVHGRGKTSDAACGRSYRVAGAPWWWWIFPGTADLSWTSRSALNRRPRPSNGPQSMPDWSGRCWPAIRWGGLWPMAPRSPFLVRTECAELRVAPHIAGQIAWAYTRRPARRLLEETATVLRRFDARTRADLARPPTTWVVATRDGVLDAAHQLASARHFDAQVVELEAVHSMVVYAPQAVIRLLENWQHPSGSDGG